MANPLDYLTWRGDIRFTERSLNEVDSLIFSELAYLDLSLVLPADGSFLPLQSVAKAYAEMNPEQQDLFFNDPTPLLDAAGRSTRFGEVEVGRYINHLDTREEIQFCAMCWKLPGGNFYVSYRGTDNSIVGWREDFALSFSEEIPGQREAVAYLEETAAALPGNLYIGGHSKGGNLAFYSGAFCDPALRDRIIHVFSHDGPGFLDPVIHSDAFQSMLPRFSLSIPESSVVGILLNNQEDRKIVKSSASGLMQHNPMTWQVLGTDFEPADGQSAFSVFLDKTLRTWLAGLDGETRRSFVTTLFDAMDASGARTLTNNGFRMRDAYSVLLRTMFEMEPERRGEIFSVLKKLTSASHDVFWSEAKASLTLSLEKASLKVSAQSSLRLSRKAKKPELSPSESEA